MRVKCLAQEHNTMSPAGARTRIARSGDERINLHEATQPLTARSWREKHVKLSYNNSFLALSNPSIFYVYCSSIDNMIGLMLSAANETSQKYYVYEPYSDVLKEKITLSIN